MPADKKKIELLAPAGNFEKLEIAIHYGADAVYVGGKNFSLRNFSGNFSEKELEEAVKFAHERNVKIYVACNIFPRNDDIPLLKEHLVRLEKIGPDAIIIADPGVFMMAKSVAPGMDIHLSTQANTTHMESVRFWKQLGVKRINLARELSLSEIRAISENCDIEVEAFIHGAMCISYSGRCLLSSFLSMRDSNRGMCSHPCRWNYAVMEQTRNNQYYPVLEDSRGTYVFNSKDLCMIDHIPEMVQSGIDSLKIEGRMKGIHYLAATVKVYREAIDAFYADPDKYEVAPWWRKELGKVGYREFCTGFYFGNPSEIAPFFDADKMINHQMFVGRIFRKIKNNRALVEVKNRVVKGDFVKLLAPKGPPREDVILDMVSAEGEKLDVAQPGNWVDISFRGECNINELVRKCNPC